MSPIATAISSSAISLVLNTLESRSTATVRSLSEATGLGQSTVTRAVAVCVSHGILQYRVGVDPASGRPCRILFPAKGLLLPALTLTRGYGSVRVLDMGLSPMGTAVTALHPASPPEEAARLLCRRCVTILRGCHGDLTVTSPILLAGEGFSPAALREAAVDILGVPPLAVVGHGEAVARAMSVRPFPSDVSSLLFLSVGQDAHACLLLRDGTGQWSPAPLGEPLTATLHRSLRGAEPSAEGIRRGVAVFLTELCRFLRPDLIYMEDPRGVLPDEGVFASLLPDGVEVAVHRVEEGLTAAEEGAALAGRRMLWEKILFG